MTAELSIHLTGGEQGAFLPQKSSSGKLTVRSQYRKPVHATVPRSPSGDPRTLASTNLPGHLHGEGS
jgi:hypothetical protein